MFVSLNPAYTIRNEVDSSFLIRVDSIINLNRSSFSAFCIPPFMGYILSHIGDFELDESISIISKSLNVSFNAIERFISQLIDSSDSKEFKIDDKLSIVLPPNLFRNPFYQSTNILGGMLQWIGREKNFRWYMTVGTDWLNTGSFKMIKSQNVVIPSPSVNITWMPKKSFQITVGYSYSGSVPSIAQLSETEQWLDTKLVYHGNASLSPYKTHKATLRFVWNTAYSNVSIRNSFTSSPGMICDMYSHTKDYMLQTIVNLSRYCVWGTQIDCSIKPLSNSTLVFWNRLVLADIKGKNEEYSWDGYRVQWISDIALNLKKWTLELYYQYPGKLVEGQLERPRAQCWSVSTLYRPNTNLSFGVEWFMPLGKGFKESEHTVNSAPVYADSEYVISDRNNLISVKLSYNFNFGRNRNRKGPQFDNIDSDSGILIK